MKNQGNNKKSINRRKIIIMKFEEALQNLRENKILTRSNWHGRRLECNNNKFWVTYESMPVNESKEWVPSQEDIWAEDWVLVDLDDIKTFHLSVNQLKDLGVSQEAIDGLENTKDKIMNKLFKDLDPSSLKDLQNISTLNVPNYKLQFPEIKRK